MTTVLLIIHLFVTLALIGVVLIQRSEGGGLGVGSTQGMGSFMSGRGTANLLTRMTAILATLFMVLSLGLALLNRGTTVNGHHSILDLPPTPVLPAAPRPAPTTPPATTPAPAAESAPTTAPATPPATTSAPAAESAPATTPATPPATTSAPAAESAPAATPATPPATTPAPATDSPQTAPAPAPAAPAPAEKP